MITLASASPQHPDMPLLFDQPYPSVAATPPCLSALTVHVDASLVAQVEVPTASAHCNSTGNLLCCCYWGCCCSY